MALAENASPNRTLRPDGARKREFASTEIAESAQSQTNYLFPRNIYDMIVPVPTPAQTISHNRFAGPYSEKSVKVAESAVHCSTQFKFTHWG
jgi:hypothetical protein